MGRVCEGMCGETKGKQNGKGMDLYFYPPSSSWHCAAELMMRSDMFYIYSLQLKICPVT